MLDERTLDDRIQETFQELGSPDMRTLAKECVSRGFWEEDQLDRAVMVWAAKRVKDACSRLDVRGIQFAIPIEKGAHPQWKQPDLFSVEDANFVIRDRINVLHEHHDSLKRLHQFFVDKFGGGVQSIPELV